MNLSLSRCITQFGFSLPLFSALLLLPHVSRAQTTSAPIGNTPTTTTNKTPAISPTLQKQMDTLLARVNKDTNNDTNLCQDIGSLQLPAQIGIPFYRRIIAHWSNALLQHPNLQPYYADSAALMLSQYGPVASAALPDLFLLLQKEGPNRSSWESVAKIAPDDIRLVPYMLQALTDYSPEAAPRVGVMLGNLGNKANSAVQPLLHMLQLQLRGENKYAAYYALGAIVKSRYGFDIPQATEILNTLPQQPTEAGAAAFVTLLSQPELPVTAVDTVVRVLASRPQPYLVYAALMVIDHSGQANRPEVLKALLDCAQIGEGTSQTSNSSFVFCAHQAQSMILKATKNHPETVPTLSEALKAPNEFERNTAVIALGRLGPAAASAAPQLLSRLKADLKADSSYDISWDADTLANMGPDAASLLPDLFELVTPGSPYLKTKSSRDDFRSSWLGMIAGIGLPQSPTQRQFVQNEVETMLLMFRQRPPVLQWREAPTELLTACFLAKQLPTLAPKVVPIAIKFLQTSETDGSMKVPQGESAAQMRAFFSAPSTTSSLVLTMKALAYMGPLASPAIPILEEYANVPKGAPIEVLRPLAQQTLAQIRPEQPTP